jgi:medium-chain acyl-[acyl-carrier-protein] hydrolase
MSGVPDPRNTRWLQYLQPRPDARLRLVCLPHAGGGAGLFRPWAAELPHWIELIAVRLPGREARIREPAAQDWPSLLATLREALAGTVQPPFALFGHSFGAMLGYELTQLGLLPCQMVVAGCAAPGLPRPMLALADLPQDELLAGLRQYGAMPDEVIDSDVLNLLLPTLRADLRLAESWPHRPPRPVKVPLLVLSGRSDPVAPVADCRRWQDFAQAGYRQAELAGDHFFPHTERSTVLALLADALTEQHAGVAR